LEFCSGTAIGCDVYVGEFTSSLITGLVARQIYQ